MGTGKFGKEDSSIPCTLVEGCLEAAASGGLITASPPALQQVTEDNEDTLGKIRENRRQRNVGPPGGKLVLGSETAKERSRVRETEGSPSQDCAVTQPTSPSEAPGYR